MKRIVLLASIIAMSVVSMFAESSMTITARAGYPYYGGSDWDASGLSRHFSYGAEIAAGLPIELSDTFAIEAQGALSYESISYGISIFSVTEGHLSLAANLLAKAQLGGISLSVGPKASVLALATVDGEDADVENRFTYGIMAELGMDFGGAEYGLGYKMDLSSVSDAELYKNSIYIYTLL